MRVLVIPDVHLKPEMFSRASEIMQKGLADRAVCLMDIADDWGMQGKIELYAKTYDAAIEFAANYQETLWCYGNHDLSYLFQTLESGYSFAAAWTVCSKLEELQHILPDPSQLSYLHRIDNVLFSHAGLTDAFARDYAGATSRSDLDTVIARINGFWRDEMWRGSSPIWCRPQYFKDKMFQKTKVLQVVGHTPVKRITKKGNLISCDTFSTDSALRPIGDQTFLVIDTKTGIWSAIG